MHTYTRGFAKYALSRRDRGRGMTLRAIFTEMEGQCNLYTYTSCSRYARPPSCTVAPSRVIAGILWHLADSTKGRTARFNLPSLTLELKGTVPRTT